MVRFVKTTLGTFLSEIDSLVCLINYHCIKHFYPPFTATLTTFILLHISIKSDLHYEATKLKVRHAEEF